MTTMKYRVRVFDKGIQRIIYRKTLSPVLQRIARANGEARYRYLDHDDRWANYIVLADEMVDGEWVPLDPVFHEMDFWNQVYAPLRTIEGGDRNLISGVTTIVRPF